MDIKREGYYYLWKNEFYTIEPEIIELYKLIAVNFVTNESGRPIYTNYFNFK